MRHYFTSIDDVLVAIRNSGHDRNFAAVVSAAFFFDEDMNFKFRYSVLRDFEFLFHFLMEEQNALSDAEFQDVIADLSKLEEKNNPIKIKKILYSRQLGELQQKFKKKQISYEVSTMQMRKYLN